MDELLNYNQTNLARLGDTCERVTRLANILVGPEMEDAVHQNSEPSPSKANGLATELKDFAYQTDIWIDRIRYQLHRIEQFTQGTNSPQPSTGAPSRSPLRG